MRRKPYRHFLHKDRSSDTTQYVTDDPVNQGRIRYITVATIINESGTLTRARFGRRTKGGFQPYHGEASLSQYIPARTRKTFHFDAGEIAAWEVVGGSEGDDLLVLFEGYEEFLTG